MKISEVLHSGVPTVKEYKTFLKSKYFKEIERYSDGFIRKVGAEISSYNKRWVKDPFHQWSRQWEYPYVIAKVEEVAKKRKNIRVLDLGSGVTFLPYYLIEKLNVAEIVALDYDDSLEELFHSVNKRVSSGKVEFIYGDMRKLGNIDKGLFDIIYSVSVLEHTNDYVKIIKDSYKLLNPKGKFILTFDISLDGKDDIPVEEAKKLICSLEKTYGKKVNIDLASILNEDSLTSEKVSKFDKSLLPWKFPIANVVKPVLKQGKLGSRYKKLTACCIVLEK